jgi:hypothetical protein
MEDERNGGFSWSPVGQLAADRPLSDQPAEDLPPADDFGAPGAFDPEAPDDAPASAGLSDEEEPAPLPTVDLAGVESAEVITPDAPAGALPPASEPAAGPITVDDEPAPAPRPSDTRRRSDVVRPLPRFMAVANQ